MKKELVNKIYNLIILDESGSMESIKHSTLNGFNELMQSINNSMKSDPEIEQWINFYSFNGAGITEQIELQRCDGLSSLTDSTYAPQDMTPLYDAIGTACNNLQKKLKEKEKYSVLVTILTDGEENASKEYNHSAISAFINSLKHRGWIFTYIGANHDVEKMAKSLNILNHLSFQANEQDVSIMFSKNSESRRKYIDKLKSGKINTLNEDFFEKEEKK